MNPYLKQRPNSRSDPPSPDASSNRKENDDDRHPSNNRQYSLLSLDTDTLPDNDKHDDDETMSLSFDQSHLPTTSSRTIGTTTATSTTITAATTNSTAAIPPPRTNRVGTSFLAQNDIDGTTTSIDTILHQFEMWMQQNLVLMSHTEESNSRLGVTHHVQQQDRVHSYLQQLLLCSKPVTNDISIWTVSRVVRFMQHIALPFLQHFLQWLLPILPHSKGTSIPPVYNDEYGTSNNNTVWAKTMIGMMYMTLHHLMEQNQIWSTYLIHVATTTTITTTNVATSTTSSTRNTLLGSHKSSSDDSNGLTLFNLLQKTFHIIVSLSHLKETKSDRCDDSHRLLTQSTIILYTSIWYTYRSIQDRCRLPNSSGCTFGDSEYIPYCQHHFQNMDNAALTSRWDDLCLDVNDTSTLLRIVCHLIYSDDPTASNTNQSIDTNYNIQHCSSKRITIYGCSLVKIYMIKKELSRNEDFTTTFTLLNENDCLNNMMQYVRNHIQFHHHNASSSCDSNTGIWNIQNKYSDVDISLHYMELLLLVYLQCSKRWCAIDSNHKLLDEIRQLILVDHVFIQYLIEMMLMSNAPTMTTTNMSGNNIEQLLQRKLNFSIVNILHDVVPDTIDAILSSQLLYSSVSTSVSIHESSHSETSHRLSQNQQSLIHIYVYQTLHALSTQVPLDRNIFDQTMECFLFLHNTQRATVRQCMISYLTNDKNACATIPNVLRQLLHYVEIHHSLPAALFLEQLVTDPTDMLRYDELSRHISNSLRDLTSTDHGESWTLANSIWQALTNTLMQHNCDEKICHSRLPYPPVLIKLIDIAYLVLRNINVTQASQQCQFQKKENLMSSMTPALTERLLEIIAPKHSLTSRADTEYSVSNDENTPTVQNLSRCDITINPDETIDCSRPSATIILSDIRFSHSVAPLEQCVQLSVATILSELTNKSYYWESTILASQEGVGSHERILNALNEFVFHTNFTSALFHTMSDSDMSSSKSVRATSLYYTSIDITRRRLRLLAVLAQQVDNEECLSNTLHISELKHRIIVFNVQKRLDHCMLQVKAYQEQEEQLLLENKSYAEQISSLESTHQYEQNEMHRKITQSAKQSVAIHAMERQQMELHVQHLSQALAKTQLELQECRQSEQRLQSTTDETKSQLKQLISSKQEHMARIQDLENEGQQTSDAFNNTKVLLQNASKKIQTLEDECNMQAEQIEDLKRSNVEVQNCLENLFGDMVKLAHVYDAKEKEVKRIEDKYESELKELRLHLKTEQDLNKQYDQLSRQKQYDYDLLQRKYQRSKEKLEQERQEHQRILAEEKQQNKRNGPISYMNQLRQEAASMNASATLTSERPSAARKKGTSNNAVDKENDTSIVKTNHRRDRMFY